ncbi:MAG: hypothetical protein HW383_823 [Candidatus Magasanikbacteria bacterium]|nr:hypothetical protein [Candidatus Magasanikbacteria bacterium]
MYLYLYDVFLKRRQFERPIAAVETRLTDFGLSGKVARLAAFANPRRLVQEEMRSGAKTIVIVGDDTTFAKVVGRIADLGLVIGWIPLGASVKFAELLGIPYGDAACETLSQRRISQIDIGIVNGRLFIGSVHIPPSNFSFNLDGQYNVKSIDQKMELWVANLDRRHVLGLIPKGAANPSDGQLEVVVRPVTRSGFFGKHLARPTFMPFQHLTVEAHHAVPLEVDGITFKEKRVVIALAPKSLRCIVGKKRKF